MTMTKERHHLLEQYNSFYLTKINRLENELIDIEREIQNILLSSITLKKDDIKLAINYMYTIKNYYSIVCDLCSAYSYIKIKPPKSLFNLIAKLTSENYLNDTIDNIRYIIKSAEEISKKNDIIGEYNVFYETLGHNSNYLKKITIDIDEYYRHF